MIYKCPGHDDRNLKVEVLKCQVCGSKVEIFSDELEVRCPKCKGLVFRVRLPSCLDWCKSVHKCVGEEKWKQLKKENKGNN